jgi:gliding motility-associated-like protein
VKYKLPYLFLLFFGGIYFSAEAQDICKNLPANAVKGDFEVIGGLESGCAPLKIELKDNSGGTSIKYEFQYEGKPEASLNITGNTNTTTTYNLPKTYTILQYGKKGGKNMYACKNIVVKTNSVPKFTYTACGNNFLNIEIPKDSVNTFPLYTIDWGDGSPIEQIDSSKLKISISKTYGNNSKQNIKVNGEFTTPSGCPSPAFTTIDMNRGQTFPRIEKITLNEVGDSAKIELKGNSEAEYSFSKREIDVVTPLTFEVNKVKAGAFSVAIADPSKAMCFFVGRFYLSCQEFSNEVCTKPFKLETINDTSKVSWQPLNTGLIENTNVYTHINYINPTLKIQEGNNIQTIQNPIFPYVYPIKSCRNKTCYTLSYEKETTYAGYTDPIYLEKNLISQTKCYKKNTIVPPKLNDSYLSVKNEKEIAFVVKKNTAWPYSFSKFFILNSTNVKIDSFTTDSKVVNPNLDLEAQSHCFKVSFEDTCGNESAPSEPICTINLQNTKGTNISWTNSIPYSLNNLSAYEVISFDETTGAEINLCVIGKTVFAFGPDYTDFENEARFIIKATNTTGEISYSNLIRIPIEASFYVPSVFSPNGDGLNDELEVFGRFGKVTDYSFRIFSRWGDEIFNSKDRNTKFNGKKVNNSEIITNGTFTYVLNITLNNKEKIEKKGKIEILR